MRELTWAPGSIGVMDYLFRPGGPTVSVEAKAVYSALFSYMAADFTAFPKVSTLAAGTSLSTRAVRYKLAELETAGLIEREYRLRNRNIDQRVTYRVHPPWAPCKTGTLQEMHPARDAPCTECTGTLQEMQPHPAPRAAMEVTHLSNPKEVTQYNARSSSSSNGKGKTKLTGAKEPSPFEEEFGLLWPFYPRTVNKAGGLKAYIATRKKGASAEELLSAVRHYGAARRGEDEKFTMHPTTFLGPAERWRDYLDPSTATHSKRVPLGLASLGEAYRQAQAEEGEGADQGPSIFDQIEQQQREDKERLKRRKFGYDALSI